VAEQPARVLIDCQLTEAGWSVQGGKNLDLYAAQDVAVRDVIMAAGHGRTDYLLYVATCSSSTASPAADRAWTEKLWVYDNQHFTLKQKTLRREQLQDFVDCYAPGKDRTERVETEQFHAFTYDELMARDKANLDITRLRDESLEDLDNLPAPEVIAREIVEDLTAALVEFEAVAAALEAASVPE
jgi:hypothetical protein